MWKALGKALAHAAVGGFITGLSTFQGGAITAKSVLLPALAGAATSVFSLFSPKPTTGN